MSNMISPGDMVTYEQLYPGMVVRLKRAETTRVDTVTAYSHDAVRGTVNVVFSNDNTNPLSGAPDSLEFEVIHIPLYVYDYHTHMQLK